MPTHEHADVDGDANAIEHADEHDHANPDHIPDVVRNTHDQSDADSDADEHHHTNPDHIPDAIVDGDYHSDVDSRTDGYRHGHPDVFADDIGNAHRDANHNEYAGHNGDADTDRDRYARAGRGRLHGRD